MSKLEPLPEDARDELMHARARARNADIAAARLEAQARAARSRARSAQQRYEDLLEEHWGQMTIEEVMDE